MIREALAGFATYAILRVLARPGRPVGPDRDGWRRLRPGLASWFVLLLGAALTGTLAYVYFVIGSARADAELQMLILPVLTIVFGLCTLCIAFFTFDHRVRWKDDIVAWQSLTGRRETHRLDEVCEVTRNDVLGTYRLRFADGATLHFSAYLRGAADLVSRLHHPLPGEEPLA